VRRSWIRAAMWLNSRSWTWISPLHLLITCSYSTNPSIPRMLKFWI